MTRDELIEDLEEGGLDPKAIDKIMKIMGGNMGEISKEEEALTPITQLELALLIEKDPITRSKLAAKIISLKLDF
jgi:hypothetical protein